MTTEIVVRVIVLAVMGAVSVSVWTLRVALTAEGRKVAAALTAGIEAVVFALVFASVLSSLDSPIEIAGYAVGVAAGTLLGLVVDGRLATGQSAIRVVVDGNANDLAASLEARGWAVMQLPHHGDVGAPTMLFIVVDQRRVRNVIGDLGRLAPGAFWTSERLQIAHPSALRASEA